MAFLWITLIVFLVLVGVSVLIGGVVYLIQRLRSGSGLVLPMRFLLRLYLYVVIIAGLLLLAQGISGLLQVGLTSALGNDFSYRPVHVRFEGKPRITDPLELKDRAQMTDAERQRLSEILDQRELGNVEQRREDRILGLERARKEGLIQGISFTLIGGIIWGAHLFSRRKLETAEDRSSPINRGYLIIMVVIFGLVTIINLPQAVFEGFRFYLLEPLNEFDRHSSPGGKLALSIVTLPIWIVYLVGAIKAARGSD
jgi:hypothetical protein